MPGPRPPPGLGGARGARGARGAARGARGARGGVARGRGPPPARSTPARGRGPRGPRPARSSPNTIKKKPAGGRGNLFDAIKKKPVLKTQVPVAPPGVSAPPRPKLKAAAKIATPPRPPPGVTVKPRSVAARGPPKKASKAPPALQKQKSAFKKTTPSNSVTSSNNDWLDTAFSKDTTAATSAPALDAQEIKLQQELAKIRKETKDLKNEQMRNEKLIQTLTKKRQKEEQKQIKEAQLKLDIKKKEREALEEKVKEMTTKTESSQTMEETYPDLMKTTRELDDVSKYYRTRISSRTRDLATLRAKLQNSRRKREDEITQLTEDFDQKRDRLASAHQDVREEMGHQHQHAVARLEDQHGRLLSDTRQVLTLLSTREFSNGTQGTGSSSGGGGRSTSPLPFTSETDMSSRSYQVEIHLYQHRWINSNKNEHVSKMCGINLMYDTIQTKPNYVGGTDSNATVPVNAIIVELNAMALLAPDCYQDLYERATSIFLSMSGNNLTKENYSMNIEKCDDGIIQGLLLSNHATTLSIMAKEMKEMVENGGTGAVSALDMSRNIAAIVTNNNMFDTMISQLQETIVKKMRTDYEKERSKNLELFEIKMREARRRAEDELGNLKYLPDKVEEIRGINQRNQTILHKMRLHFEQVRLASMIEHKSMEAQLRKLSKRLNKVLVRKQRLDDRDNALRLAVETKVASIWEPKLKLCQERSEKILNDLRAESTEKINNVETIVRERLEQDYGEIIMQYNIKLEQSQCALEKSHEIFEQRTAEVESIQNQLEHFAQEKMVYEQEEKRNAIMHQFDTREHTDELKQARAFVKQIWEQESTPLEHRLKFLESVVNEADENDDVLLEHMQQYADKLEKFT